MHIDLPHDVSFEFEPSDYIFDATKWDRRRRDHVRAWAVRFLDHAATHLIEDQMRPDRRYSPGAAEAVELLRGCIARIEGDEMQHQRGERAAASWLPKHVLAQQWRNGPTDA